MQKGQTCHHKDKNNAENILIHHQHGKYIFMLGLRPVPPPSIYLRHFYRVKKHKRQSKEIAIRSARAVLINLVPFICLLHVSHSIYHPNFDKEMEQAIKSNFNTFEVNTISDNTRNRCLRCIQPASLRDAEVCKALKRVLI